VTPIAAAIFPETAARVEAWAADPDVLGVLLVGSKARGHEDSRSDDDLEVLLTEAAFARIAPADCHALP
jgi:predicted nucleotidyltransferase